MNKQDFYKEFGKRFKRYRVASLLTQDDMSYLLGISRPAIAEIEAGRQQLPLYLLHSVCIIFNIMHIEIIPIMQCNPHTIEELKEAKTKAALDNLEESFKK